MNPLLRRGRRSAARGSTLIIAILVLLVMTVAGVALMFNTSVENSLAGNETRMSKAFYAADSGIQYAASQMATSGSYVGGDIPGGMSSNTPGSPAQDITVSVAPPVPLGYFIRDGDQFQSQGSAYGTVQTIEAIYRVESTANSDEIRASKVITAQISVYPKQLRVE
jgi:hypothetical protein